MEFWFPQSAKLAFSKTPPEEASTPERRTENRGTRSRDLSPKDGLTKGTTGSRAHKFAEWEGRNRPAGWDNSYVCQKEEAFSIISMWPNFIKGFLFDQLYPLFKKKIIWPPSKLLKGKSLFLSNNASKFKGIFVFHLLYEIIISGK